MKTQNENAEGVGRIPMRIRVQIEAVGPDLAACAARFADVARETSEQLDLLVPYSTQLAATGGTRMPVRLVVEGEGRAVAHLTVKPD